MRTTLPHLARHRPSERRHAIVASALAAGLLNIAQGCAVMPAAPRDAQALPDSSLDATRPVDSAAPVDAGESVDADLRLDAESLPDAGRPDASRPSGIRWRPGHYIKTQGNPTVPDQAGYLAGVLRSIDRRVEDHPEVLGVFVAIAWGAIETGTRVYDLSQVQMLLDDLAARGKHLILYIGYKAFGSAGPFFVPPDLTSRVHESPGRRGGGSTFVASVWEPDVMDRYIAMWQAVATAFDDHPNMEMVTWSESAPSFRGSPPAGYSSSRLATELQRLYVANGAAWSQTNVAAMINNGQQVGGTDGLMEAAYAANIGRGAPDLTDRVQAFDTFRGEGTGSFASVRDYRGEIPHMAIWSSPVARRPGVTGDPASALSWALTQGVTHLLWTTSNPGEDSWANVLAAIDTTAGPDIGDAACPARYEASRGGCR